MPSSTDASESSTSLFDHLADGCARRLHLALQTADKTTSSQLFDKQDTFYNEKAFPCSQLSTSQAPRTSTIHSSGAAKILRARGFCLEVLTEHLIDELLALVGLSRANLFSGGGHAYLLLPF